MKNRYFVLIVTLGMAVGTHIAASSPAPTQAICIEHAGESDKAITGIAISASDLGIELCRKDSDERVGLSNVWRHVVDTNVVLRLITAVERISSDEEQHPHEFGTLFVVIIRGADRHVVVLSQTHSVALLAELRKSCSDRPLRSRLNALQARIESRETKTKSGAD